MQSRQFALTASLVLVSFLLLGASFILLSYRYIVADKQKTLTQDAQYISSFTATYLSENGDLLDNLYQSYVTSIAHVTDSYVILADASGNVIYASDGTRSYPYNGSVALPSDVVSVISGGSAYTGTSTLGGLFDSKQFASGLPVRLDSNTSGSVDGMVLVTSSMSSLTVMWRALGQIFFFSAVIICCIAAVASSITARKMSQPLKEMAAAAHKFGHGEFDVRVTGYEKRRDEIGELCTAFNAMADSLSQSEQQRSEFIANISHELKTPMTTIAGFADGILDGTIPRESEAKYLQIISNETRRLSRLVRRMLELSRLDSKETVTAQEQFDISETMLRVLVSLEPKITPRKLDVDADLPDNPVKVWGDPDQITQVCYNLLDNAIKFAPEGSTIGVSIRPAGNKARISVRNLGDTIPPQELPLLFDRFHKTDKSRGIDRDGVGLGLYIVKAVLDNHKEDITVTSENGVTTFTFTLTLA